MKECDSSILYCILLCFYLLSLYIFSILYVTLIDSCLFDRYGAYAYVYGFYCQRMCKLGARTVYSHNLVHDIWIIFIVLLESMTICKIYDPHINDVWFTRSYFVSQCLVSRWLCVEYAHDLIHWNLMYLKCFVLANNSTLNTVKKYAHDV